LAIDVPGPLASSHTVIAVVCGGDFWLPDFICRLVLPIRKRQSKAKQNIHSQYYKTEQHEWDLLLRQRCATKTYDTVLCRSPARDYALSCAAVQVHHRSSDTRLGDVDQCRVIREWLMRAQERGGDGRVEYLSTRNESQ